MSDHPTSDHPLNPGHPANSSNLSSAPESEPTAAPGPAAPSGSGPAIPAPSSPLSFMLEAIRLAEAGMSANSGGPFGCVIVKDGKIIGTGNNQVIAGLDPTAHAEIVAIREACQHLHSFQLTDCELYTTCEPCPMCMGAIYWARPRIVYFANTREDAARIGFDDSFIYQQLALPAENRKIPLIPLGRTEALPLFSQWQDKADKTTY